MIQSTPANPHQNSWKIKYQDSGLVKVCLLHVSIGPLWSIKNFCFVLLFLRRTQQRVSGVHLTSKLPRYQCGGTWWHTWEAIPIPSHNPKGPKALLITSRGQTRQDALRWSLSRSWLFRALLAAQGPAVWRGWSSYVWYTHPHAWSSTIMNFSHVLWLQSAVVKFSGITACEIKRINSFIKKIRKKVYILI